MREEPYLHCEPIVRENRRHEVEELVAIAAGSKGDLGGLGDERSEMRREVLLVGPVVYDPASEKIAALSIGDRSGSDVKVSRRGGEEGLRALTASLSVTR
jgi:hypothetical protein